MKYLPFLLLLALASCKNDPKATEATAAAATNPELPPDFLEFYQQFHSDSLFQVEHIVFPLEGLPDNADSATVASKTFRWTPETWRMQGPVDYQVSEYQRDIVPLTETLVMERITHKTGDFAMERRFHKAGNEWQLIYYAGVNRIAK